MVDVEDCVGMETFEKLAGAIDETGIIPQEEVRGVDRGVGMATL